MIRVGADIPNPTHHVSLSDGQTTVGLVITNVNGDAMPTAISASASPRTALKTTTGNTQYSDLEPPWSAIAQSDWSNGIGQEDEDDVARYFDGHRANTMFESVMLAPLETYTTGYRSQSFRLPGSMEWQSLIGARKYLARKISPGPFNAYNVYLYLRKRGSPASDPVVKILAEDSGKPGLPLTGTNLTLGYDYEIDDTEAVFKKITFSTPAGFSAATDYWIQISNTDGDDDNYWQVGVKSETGNTKKSTNGTTWATDTVNLYFRVTGSDTAPSRVKFFQYKNQQFMIKSAATGAPVLYINGDIGVADSNSADKTLLNDATKSWTVDEWAGCVVAVIDGSGSAEVKNWRKVVSNTATTLTVDSAWLIAHTTSTMYTITNSDKWSIVAGHGLTAPVTDVLAVGSVLYYCMGSSADVRKAEYYENSGTGEWRYADETDTKAKFMCTVRDATDGLVIWRANDMTVSVADEEPEWEAPLDFSGTVAFTDDKGRINSICEYGDTKQLWVFREGSVFTMSDGKPDEIPLKEMRAMMSTENGIASLTHNNYLYFNLGSGIERYVGGDLLDVGMNRGSGLPADRQGIVNLLIGYPGRIFAAVDGGATNYSSLFGYNMLGWHELYRTPVVDQKIYSGQFQTINGSDPDKLWLCCGEDIIWLAFPSLSVDPTKDANMLYCPEGSIISSWLYNGLFDVQKLWNSIKLFMRNVTTTGIRVEVDYQVDDDTAWTPIDCNFDAVPTVESDFSEDSITGKRLRYRLRLMTNNKNISPVVKTSVVESVARVPVKYSYTFSYRCTDDRTDLGGHKEELTADELYAIIDGWAANLTKLTMRSIYRRYDDIKVFIDPPPNNPIEQNTEGYLDRLTVTAL